MSRELLVQMCGDELERLKQYAEKRGVTPEELLSSQVEKGLTAMTRPATRRGVVTAFRRKERTE